MRTSCHAGGMRNRVILAMVFSSVTGLPSAFRYENPVPFDPWRRMP